MAWKPLLLAALACACAMSAAKAQDRQTPPADAALAAYADARDAARLPDGRSIHVVCMGEGSPTVILTAGSSGWSIGWHSVQPAVAARTRVCAWDRANFGLSSGVPHAQAVDETSRDLQDALKSAAIPGPYVLVAESRGGLDSLMFADRERQQVAGMVLVDVSFPDQSERLKRAAPDVIAWGDTHLPPFAAALQKCADALNAGTLRPGGPDPDGCLVRRWPPSWPQEVRTALDRARAQQSASSLAASLLGIHTDPSGTIAIKPDRNYGDMPMIVLAAGINQGGPDLPPDLKAKVPLVAIEWRRGNADLAALSSRGVFRVVPDSGHDIVGTRPQIEAINEVVDLARTAAPR
jgi:pimeloyl-ACP methyl ester carboxylesterase